MAKVANPECVNCKHTARHHRLDSAKNVSPNDPAAKFRCVWPLGLTFFAQDCDCPDMVVPADAGWPYNNAPEPSDG